MWLLTLLSFALPLCLSFTTATGKMVHKRNDGYAAVCKELSQRISSASRVYYPGNPQYVADIAAWSHTNMVDAACVVEPGNSKDVASILNILESMKANFAVKSGGHSANTGFSSTVGVLVAMHRFVGAKYDSASQTAVIGTGMLWEDVYQALEPHNVSVLGARAPGVGVGGFLLGGGYSYKTNQHGLAIDTITAFELVQPNGEIITVTHKSHPDLFFGLKGGFNNFGIVTQFTMKTFPQTTVWGGVIKYKYNMTNFIALKSAFDDFTGKHQDPKASIMTSFTYTPSDLTIVQTLFYDGPSQPKGLFDRFLGIPSVAQDISERSLVSMVQSQSSHAVGGLRTSFAMVPIQQFNSYVMDMTISEIDYWSGNLRHKDTSFVAASYVMEPFSHNILSHNTEPTAYPPDRSNAFSLLHFTYMWTASADDKDFYSAASTSQAELRTMIQRRQPLIENAPLYPNFALLDTPLEQMYGKNVGKLRALKEKVDPKNVMGLAGGFKF